MKILTTLKKNEHGNALFLILIAVALFAALSYAVTQSGRGGGGVDREQALISASQITQYAAGLRSTVTRMLITGTGVGDLDFGTASAVEDRVFDTAGGGAIEQDPPPSAQTAATPYDYLDALATTNGWYVFNLGSDTEGTGRDVMIAASNLDDNVCNEINRGLGLAVVPVQETVAVNLTTPAAGDAAATVHTATFSSNPGEAFACVDNDPGAGFAFVYYHALVEQ